MGRHEWERDIRQRQRNIVFPDTVLNTANFYRTVFRGRASLPRTHRFGLLLLAALFLFGGCIWFAASVADLLSSTDGINNLLSVLGVAAAVASCAFAIALVIRAVIGDPAPTRPRKRARGHIPMRNS